MRLLLSMAGLLVLGIVVVSCTLVFNNHGKVEIKETDSHDAGTNSRAIDLNISPR